MKVLVTGATGFLGSNLVKALIKEGHHVIILKRSGSDLRRLLEVHSEIMSYNVDVVNINDVFRDTGAVDAVIHTATCYGRKGETAEEIFKVNTALPLSILEAATAANVSLFLNTDTILDKFINPYALSKKQFHDWGKLFAASGRIRFININLEHMYGPGDDTSKFSTYVINSCLDNVAEILLTPGEQKRDFIYIDDVVSAYLMLLEKAPLVSGAYQEYDLGSGCAVSIRHFVETVRRLTQSETVMKFGAIAYRENETMESHADTTLLQSLGWRSRISLEQGIQLCIEERIRGK